MKQSYWVDKTGEATWASAASAPYESFDETLTMGFVSRPVWLRLRIASSSEVDHLVIRIKPSILGKIELFDPQSPTFNPDAPPLSGRWVPLGPNAYPSTALGFLIDPSAQDRDVYLRVVSDTAIIVAPEVLTMHQARLEDSQHIFSQAIYVGLIVFLAFWALMGFFERQEKIYLLFLLRELYAAFHALFIFGFGHFYLSRWVSTEALIWGYDWIVLTIAVPGVVFELTLLKELGTSQRVRRWTWGVLAASFLGSIGFWAFGDIVWARVWNQSLGLLLTVLISYLGFFAKVDSDVDKTRRVPIRWLLKTYYVSFFLTLMVPMLVFLGAIKSPPWIVDLVVFHGALTGLMLMVLLALRSRARELMNQAMTIRHELMTQELVKEREMRTDKERFLDMLAHEMKNPLTAVNLLLDAKTANGREIQKAVNDMNRVIDRALQVGRVDDARDAPVMVWTDVQELLKNSRLGLANQERIVFTGHGPLAVKTDEEMLSIVLGNLLENALKYSPPASPIAIEARFIASDSPAIEVRISNAVGDAGAPDPMQVFQKYYRSPRAHRQVGSGLGLYLVAELLKGLGGSIRLDQAALAHAKVEFVVSLPVQTADEKTLEH